MSHQPRLHGGYSTVTKRNRLRHGASRKYRRRPMSKAEYTITLHDPKQDTDEEVAERLGFSNTIQAELLPDEEPTPVEQAIAGLRASPERYKRWSFRAR